MKKRSIVLVVLLLAMALFALALIPEGVFQRKKVVNWLTADRDFPTVQVRPSTATFEFNTPAQAAFPQSFTDSIARTQTTALLIIRNDSMLYEHYFNGATPETAFPGFEISRSIVGMLAGVAQQEGLLPPLDAPLGKFFPAIQDSALRQIELRDLLNMRTGIVYHESYQDPDSGMAYDYMSTDNSQRLERLSYDSSATGFQPAAINTWLLARILEQSTRTPVASYLQSKLWQPLKMEAPATWSLDKQDGQVKAFCCFRARASDYARLGRLYLNLGYLDDKAIAPRDWVLNTLDLQKTVPGVPYALHWYRNEKITNYAVPYLKTDPYPQLLRRLGFNARDTLQSSFTGPINDAYAKGYLGQYLYLNPLKQVLIVRFGRIEERGTQILDALTGLSRTL